jgi:uncharacterized protein with FMN-binding domain
MKRALLIAGGTLGGLGAVMAITPPQLGSNQALDLGSATTASTPAAALAKSAPAPTQPTAKATTKTSTTSKPVATKKAAVTQSAAKATATASASATTTTATSAPAAAPAAKGVTGVFVGPTVDVSYGNVQVQITVKDGQITDAKALQAPSGRSQRYTDRAVPVLRQQTLAAQSDAIQGASGASYTSYGWFKSLQGALAKAGL